MHLSLPDHSLPSSSQPRMEGSLPTSTTRAHGFSLTCVGQPVTMFALFDGGLGRWRPNQAVHTYKHIPHLSGREPDSAGETCQPGVHSTQAERNLHFARKKMGLVQRRLEAATSSVPVQHLQVETGCGAQSPASVLKAPTPSSQANGPPSSSNGGTSACL